jgi:hypothetical protein
MGGEVEVARVVDAPNRVRAPCRARLRQPPTARPGRPQCPARRSGGVPAEHPRTSGGLDARRRAGASTMVIADPSSIRSRIRSPPSRCSRRNASRLAAAADADARPLSHRNQDGDGTRVLRDHDRLPRLDLVEQAGEMGLGLVHSDLSHLHTVSDWSATARAGRWRSRRTGRARSDISPAAAR